jgi:Phospholipase_D-nuclease N-terminal/Short C-terminal domain
LLASSYPFLDVLWTMIIFFVWVMWFWLLIVIFRDIFRRHDISGWGKTAWLIFVICLPFLGVFVYLISQNKGINERNLKEMDAQKAQFDSAVRDAGGGGAAGEIERGKKLLDSGAITQAEFDAIKQKALAA